MNRSTRNPSTPRRAPAAALLATGALVLSGLALSPAPAAAAAAQPSADPPPAPSVLAGETWLAHHRDDLMPYWDLPEALGEPLGNFPTFRGRAGELLPDTTSRGTSTLGRGVYGYSLAFMLTGEERYLGYARAGLDWIEAHAEDRVRGGYFADLDASGAPLDPDADKDVFDLASVGLGYAMYFNATRDPDAERHLLEIRDLLFGPYYDAATNRVKDSLNADLSTEVDTGANGGDITDYLVPGTAMFLPTAALLSDPARRDQFRTDLRRLTQGLIDRHKNSADANAANRWMFWGRTLRFGSFNAPQTDFGHNIKSYAMVHNANLQFADRPWDALAADRATMLDRAWDEAAGRWNQRPRSFVAGNVEPDSAWWIHDEADQLLAALDLDDGFTGVDRLARSAQTFLDVYVDRDPAYPVRETFARVSRVPEDTDLRKSFRGKNMLHNMEHALILYLHGSALEGRPARLHYAFPHDQALTAVAKPYWFDATGQSRTNVRPLETMPGHDLVTVDFTGIGQVPREPYPAPDDHMAPVTTATVEPSANAAGWHRDDVTVSLAATDELVGVKEIHVQVEDPRGLRRGVASVHPGAAVTLPAFTDDGVYDLTYFAVDALGNSEAPRTLRIRVDRTAPAVWGLPRQPCRLWPPDHRFVHVATVRAADALSGVEHVVLTARSDQGGWGDAVVIRRHVFLRAERDHGRVRVYTVRAWVADEAGNVTQASATCTVERPPESWR
jgi:hypothetical protein